MIIDELKRLIEEVLTSHDLASQVAALERVKDWMEAELGPKGELAKSFKKIKDKAAASREKAKLKTMEKNPEKYKLVDRIWYKKRSTLPNHIIVRLRTASLKIKNYIFGWTGLGVKLIAPTPS